MDADDWKPCPQCKYEAHLVYDFSYYLNFLECYVCGFRYWLDPCSTEKLRKGILFPEDNFVQDERRILVQRGYIRKGYGAYQISHKNRNRKYRSFYRPLTQEDIEKFLMEFEDPDTDQAESYLTKWSDESKSVELIFGTNSYMSEGPQYRGVSH
jgi:hypothetical protein